MNVTVPCCQPEASVLVTTEMTGWIAVLPPVGVTVSQAALLPPSSSASPQPGSSPLPPAAGRRPDPPSA